MKQGHPDDLPNLTTTDDGFISLLFRQVMFVFFWQIFIILWIIIIFKLVK